MCRGSHSQNKQRTHERTGYLFWAPRLFLRSTQYILSIQVKTRQRNPKTHPKTVSPPHAAKSGPTAGLLLVAAPRAPVGAARAPPLREAPPWHVPPPWSYLVGVRGRVRC